MSDTKNDILETAVTIVQRRGYAELTMRQLATECDMKLASLQYHFKSWDVLIEAIAGHILNEYSSRWSGTNDPIESVSLPVFIEFILNDINQLEAARLWPQLRAWGLVEPRMRKMLSTIYSFYLDFLTQKFEQLGSKSPKVEALTMMITLEGTSIFAGKGSDYYGDLEDIKKLILDSLQLRFGTDGKLKGTD